MVHLGLTDEKSHERERSGTLRYGVRGYGTVVQDGARLFRDGNQ